MGIQLIHLAVGMGLVLVIIRTWTYWLLNNNEDSQLGKFLAYTFA